MKWIEKKMGLFTLRYSPYTLELKHVFTVASFSRKTSPVILVQLEMDGVVGLGEASMPPYLGESQETVISFIEKVDLSGFSSPFQTEDIISYIDSIDQNNTAAKAAIDIALHDLMGKMLDMPLYKLWGYNPQNIPPTSFTIGIDTEEVIIHKVKEAASFKILKVKLGLQTDKMIVETIRKVTDKPLCADVNQGWKDPKEALEMAHYLSEKGVEFLEQPMPKDQIDDLAWLTQNSPIPIIADEGCQRLDDIAPLKGIYNGINIKLMKCTGLWEARKMIQLAQGLDMKIMLGCMTETSCAISAAAQIAPQVDWVDLDGALLIKNDPYTGMQVKEGLCYLPDAPGIGLH